MKIPSRESSLTATVESGAEALSASLDENLTLALIEKYGLSPEQVALISEKMRERGMRFMEAAIHLKLIVLDEATAAPEQPNRKAAQEGIIQTALRRVSIGQVTTVPPSIYVKPAKHLLLACSPEHPHCERLRALRTELLLVLGAKSRQADSIALLSPSSGEGRSQLTAELAIAFAQLGRRTLLVEADMRRPRQHLNFAAENAAGLSQSLLLGTAPQLLKVEGLPDLSLLTAGPVPPNPLELLTNGRFDRLLTDWRRAFDIVLIDTPAVTDFADGLAIASFAKQVLLLSRANATGHKEMKDTLRRLATTNARILGAVINKF
jgi:protein-tyrosine kinase